MTNDEVKKFEELWRDGMPIKDIARTLCYSEKYLHTYMEKHRIMFPYRQQRVTTRNTKMVLDMVEQGLGTSEISKMSGLNKHTIARILGEASA